jgi:hypothetical protein
MNDQNSKYTDSPLVDLKASYVLLFKKYKSDSKCGVNNLLILVMRKYIAQCIGLGRQPRSYYPKSSYYYGGLAVSYLFKGRVYGLFYFFTRATSDTVTIWTVC